MKTKSRYDVRLLEDPDKLLFVILTPEEADPPKLQELMMPMFMGQVVLCGREEENEIVPSMVSILPDGNSPVLDFNLSDE